MNKLILILIISLLYAGAAHTDDVFNDSFAVPTVVYIIDHFCFEFDPVTQEWYSVPCPDIFKDSFEQE